MFIRRWHRSERRRSEQLLACDPGGCAESDDPVARLLTAAAGPARPAELRGEQQVVNAFRAARSTRSPAYCGQIVRSGASPGTHATHRLTIVGLSWGVAITAGVAVAAAVPDGRPGVPLSAVASRGTQARSSAAAPPVGVVTTIGSPGTRSASRTGGTAGAPADPGGEQLTTRQLCLRYLDHPGRDRDQALDAAGLRALIEAAGGRRGVDPYCRRLASAGATHRPVPTPGPDDVRPGPRRSPRPGPTHSGRR